MIGSIQNHQISLSLKDNATTSNEGPSRIREIFNNKIQRAPSPPKTDDSLSESELGLSLRLQTSTSKKEMKEDKEDKTEQPASFASSAPNKLQRTHELSGIAAHVATPPNRKARVSVRARCEAATVSSKSLYIHICSHQANSMISITFRAN